MPSFVALDFETSDYSRESACSIGLVKVENNIITQEYTRLIRPPRKIMRFTDIHGIRWEDVANEPTFAELWSEFQPFCEGVDFIAAHNAPFDRGVLQGCCEYYSINSPQLPFTCTVQLARREFKISPAKLSNVCRVLEIDLRHHEALSDARACAQIVIRAQRLKDEVESQNEKLFDRLEFKCENL